VPIVEYVACLVWFDLQETLKGWG